jgi:hypothetical protein
VHKKKIINTENQLDYFDCSNLSFGGDLNQTIECSTICKQLRFSRNRLTSIVKCKRKNKGNEISVHVFAVRSLPLPTLSLHIVSRRFRLFPKLTFQVWVGMSHRSEQVEQSLETLELRNLNSLMIDSKRF